MISAVDQGTRHIQAVFENENGFVLTRVVGRRGLSELFQFDLTLLHGETKKTVHPADVIGLGATIQIQMPNETTSREYYGVISELRQVDWSEDGLIYHATMVPALWFLTQRHNCRIFQREKTKDIVEKVLRDAGIDSFQFKLAGTYTEREYCVQYRESDFNFISRLLEEEGIFYYFEHAEGQHKVVFCDAERFYFDLDINEIHFPRPGDTLLNRHELLTWHERYRFIPGRVTQKDFNFKEPYTQSLLQQRQSTIQLANNSHCEIYDYHGRYVDEQNGHHLTEVRMGEYEKDYETGFATSNLAFIEPGGKFRFGTHRIDDHRNKSYVVTHVEFEARAGSYHTERVGMTSEESHAEAYYLNNFQCIPSERVFRPSRTAARPSIQGPQTAIVTTENEEELTVDEHGRVHVHFHWDRYSSFDEDSSCWIRVSQVHAGEGFGMMDIPRRNEEVIVSFIEGDPDRPIITGRVYNGANQPPFDLSEGSNAENKTRRGNATKSVGKGKDHYNEMSMDDTPGKEQMRLNAQHNMDSNVGNNQTQQVGVDRMASVGNNESLSVGVNQEQTIGANRTTQIGANDSTTIAGNQSINVGANQSTNVGANQSNSIASTQSNQIGMARNTMVGAVDNEVVGFTKTTNVGVALLTTVGALNAEQVAGVKSIIAGTTVKIQCGASSLTMDAGGTITLQGTQMLLDSTGPVKINGSVIDLN